MCDIMSKQMSEKVAKAAGVQYFTFGNGQGLVGSLGAMGCLLEGDHTFELIAYRKQKRSEEHTSELQSRQYLVCRLLLEKKNNLLSLSCHLSHCLSCSVF